MRCTMCERKFDTRFPHLCISVFTGREYYTANVHANCVKELVPMAAYNRLVSMILKSGRVQGRLFGDVESAQGHLERGKRKFVSMYDSAGVRHMLTYPPTEER